LATFLNDEGIRHDFTSVGHPQSNGLAERTIRNLTDRLCAVIEDGILDWKSKLGKIALALNTSVQESTKMTPFELVTGRQAVLPGEFEALHRSLDPEQCRTITRQNNEAAQIRQKLYHDRKRRPAPVWETGQLVYVQNKQLRPGFSSKLLPKFVGPFRVLRRIGTSTYQLRNPQSGRQMTANITELKPHVPMGTLE
jgi:hypothetical protein